MVRENNEYLNSYWDEFKFDIEFALRRSKLQPQVVVVHEHTLSHYEGWDKAMDRAASLSLPYNVTNQYQELKHRIESALDQLVEHKFAEERDESIAEAVQKFRESLTATNKFVVLNDVYIFPQSYPEAFDYYIESLLKKKISRKEICLDSVIEGIAIHRSIVAEHAQDPGSLSEWCSIHESFQQVYSYIGIENARPLAAQVVSLKKESFMKNLCIESRKNYCL